MNSSEIIASHLVKTSFSDLPQKAIDRAKVRILDSIGVLIAGAGAAGNEAAINLIKSWGGAEESTILVYGGKVPAHQAAFVNSLMTRSYDFEAVEAEGADGKTGPAHISGSTVPAALATAEKQGASGKDLLLALILGDDLASRLSMATGFSFGAGWDNTGTVNGFGCAAAAAKLLGLNAVQIQNALAIVLNQIGGTMDGVRDRVMGFKLPQGLSSRAGVFSAELAKTGFLASKDAFTGRHGYFDLFCRDSAIPEVLTADLGKYFYADCAIKPWPCCRMNHPSLDAALRIVNGHQFEVEDIEEIILRLSPAAELVDAPFEPGDTPQVAAAFNVRFVVATAVVKKELKPKHFCEACYNDPAIRSLINKIKLEYDPAKKMFNADVYIKLKDGTVYTASTTVPKGDLAHNPLTYEEIKEKYWSNVEFSKTISVKNAEEVLKGIEKLEDIPNIRELISLLVV